jgi:hypothetical protein
VNTAGSNAGLNQYRLPLYGLLNFGFICYITVASAIGKSASPRLFYLAVLFAICSSSVLLLRKANDRFALYTIFLVMYFVSFGALDLIALTSATDIASSTSSILSEGELLIILGGVAFALGYQTSASRRQSSAPAIDWPMSTLVIVGLFLWLAGTFAEWYWTIRLTVRAGEFKNTSGEALTTILMMGRYAQPLGILIVAYAYTISRSIFLALITIALASFQVVLGFASDTKGGAMTGGIMVIVTGFLVTGKIPKAWAVAGALFIVVGFPIFQAHRTIVVNERGLSNADTAQNIGKALQLSIEGQKRTEAAHAESLFQRSSVKSAVEMIVRKTGDSVPYQHGYTLIPLATAFIPRLIWRDKLDVQTGLLVDQQFHVTGLGEVYISPSHLGELYWNFGWPGAITGMLLLGLVTGWINSRCDMSKGVSVTRLLILATTIYQVGIRFESSIAAEYAMWLRSIAGILIMHWLFHRRSAAPEAISSSSSSDVKTSNDVPLPKFPNLLR